METTVTVDYERFRKLEEIEKELIKSKSEDGVVIQIIQRFLDHVRSAGTREIKVVSGTETTKLLVDEIKKLQASNGDIYEAYKNLYRVTPQKYRDRAIGY